MVILKRSGKKDRKAKRHRSAVLEPKRWMQDDAMFKNAPSYILNVRSVIREPVSQRIIGKQIDKLENMTPRHKKLVYRIMY